MSGDEKYKVVSKENDEDDAVKRGLTEYEASIKIGKFLCKGETEVSREKKEKIQQGWFWENFLLHIFCTSHTLC